ncbi:MAG: SUMF1/EgtB/PvdO family nonheme iron enzyme [Myxococcales bacterium]|nr:SUMF1/EgtB/PvdO family nonheme iron enzyme [Myxococcales bacterium]
MRSAAIVLVLAVACSGPTSGHELDVDASVDATPDGDAACALPAPAAVCDPAAKPLPNPSCLAEDPGTGGCPAGMVRIPAATPFCIDRHEASLEGASPYWNPGATPPRARSLANAVPQGYISGRQAAAACAAAGKRLCTDAEWQRACRGPANTTYPYGNTRMPGVCNDARSQHPAVEYFMTTDPSIYSKLGHPCLNQLPASLDRTGTNPGCVTAEGVFDMMGNLHEWTSAPAGTFRGGFYVDTMINGNGCLYATTAHDTGHSDYSTGFRCCAD